jgi:hypothetical protein
LSKRRKIEGPSTALRVSVGTWKALNVLKCPGEPFDGVIKRLLAKEGR